MVVCRLNSRSSICSFHLPTGFAMAPRIWKDFRLVQSAPSEILKILIGSHPSSTQSEQAKNQRVAVPAESAPGDGVVSECVACAL